MDLFDLVAKLTLDSSEYESGITKAGDKVDDLKKKWDGGTKQITGGLKKVGTGVGVLAGGAALLFKSADGFAKTTDEIDKMSQKLGLSTDAYQKWDYVLQISGADIKNMSTGLKTLTNKFDDAVNGSDTAVETFEKLGLSMDEISGLSREDLFAKVITAFQGMEDSAERAALANDLFGKSGQELAPLFNTTAEETQALMTQVEELGGVMSEDTVKAGAQFKDSMTALDAAFKGAGASLFEQLIPGLTSLMDKASEFIADGGLEKIVNLFKILAPLIGVIVAGFAGFKIITGIITIIQGLTTVFGVLNAVMAANPIGIVVLAIAGLVAAFALLWNKCDAFREFWINLWNTIKETFASIWESIKAFFTQDIPNTINNVVNFFKELPGKALQWGKDLLDSFIQGIKDKINAVKDTIAGVANTIKDFLGFSEPDKGPLANFHTFAPDMMDLFMKGIEDNTDELQKTLADSFDFEPIIAGAALSGSAELSSSSGSSSDQPTPVNVTVTLAGDAARLFEVMRNEDNKFIKSNGYSAFGTV